jgi:plastocyanin
VSSSIQANAFDVHYTDTGFQPSLLTVRKGDVVTFTNDSNVGMWVASNPHPTHTDYPELNMHTSVGKDSKFIFTFDKTGTWGYHNHLNQNHQAVIVVDPR